MKFGCGVFWNIFCIGLTFFVERYGCLRSEVDEDTGHTTWYTMDVKDVVITVMPLPFLVFVISIPFITEEVMAEGEEDQTDDIVLHVNGEAVSGEGAE